MFPITEVLLVLTFWPLSVSAQPGALDTSFDPALPSKSWVTAIYLLDDGKLLLGGAFPDSVGGNKRALVKLNPDGTLDAQFNETRLVFGPEVYGLRIGPSARLADGRWLVGVTEARLDGTQNFYLRRRNVDGSADPAFAGGDSVDLSDFSHVDAVAVQSDGRILVGGVFSSVAGAPRSSLARLNADGTLDMNFGNELWQRYNSVQGLAIQADGKILVAGSVEGTQWSEAFVLRRLLSDGSLDASFPPNGGLLPGLVVTDIHPQRSGDMIVQGFVPSTHLPLTVILLKLGKDGTPAPTTRAEFLCDHYQLSHVEILPDQRLLIAGGFSVVHGAPRVGIARLHPDGRLDTGFDPGADVPYGFITVTAQPDGALLVGGAFQIVANAARNGLARFNPGSVPPAPARITRHPASQSSRDLNYVFFNAAATSLAPLTLQWIHDGRSIPGATNTWLALTNLQLNQAGAYAAIASSEFGSTTSRLATLTLKPRTTAPGELDLSFRPVALQTGEGQGVDCIALQPDGKILIGGAFASVNGLNTRRVARLDPDGAVDSSFRSDLSDEGYYFRANTLLTRNDRTVLVGTSGGVKPLRRLKPDGSEDPAFIAPLTGIVDSATRPDVFALAPHEGGRLLVGGRFAASDADGRQRVSLVRLNSDGSLDTTFEPVAFEGSRLVHSLLPLPDGRVLIGGNYTLGGFPSAANIARLNADGSVDTNFVANVEVPSVSDPFGVRTMLRQPDGKIILGGSFGKVNGVDHKNVARLNPDGSLDHSFVLAVNGPVNSLALDPAGRLLVAGEFTNAAGIFRNSVARINPDGLPDLSFDPGPGPPGGRAYHVKTILVQSDDRILVVGPFYAFDSLAFQGVARLHGAGPILDQPTLLDPVQTAGALRFSMLAAVGRRFTLETQASLDGPVWEQLSAFIGAGRLHTFTVNVAGRKSGFFRIRAD